ncbi:MAG: type 4a pilus biogenesis protein PilO [Patescibacteria group bacterium]
MENTKKTSQLGSFISGHENQVNMVIVLVLIVVFSLWYFSFLPTKANLHDTKIQIENLKRDVAALQEKRVRLGSLEKNIEQRAAFVSEVLDVLPDTQQVPEVLFTLEQLAQKNNLYITDFTPKNKEEERVVIPGEVAPRNTVAAWKTVQLEFNLTGSYADLKQFLHDLESNIRPIDVQTITINGGGELNPDKTPQPLRFGVTAFTYYQEVGK